MSNKDRVYKAEIHSGFRLVTITDFDELAGRVEVIGRLAPRLDLAPALPSGFDWSRCGVKPAAERLALAMLADALRNEPDGDELAVRLAPTFLETVLSFEPLGFRFNAAALARWAVEAGRPDSYQVLRRAV